MLFRFARQAIKTPLGRAPSAPGVLNKVASSGYQWIEKIRQSAGTDESGWKTVAGLNRTDAEQLLDWLENQVISEKELLFDPAAGFTVRWRAKTE
jgi:hypothetical protein